MDTNKCKLTLEEHINKCPYEIIKKIYKIVVEEAENVFDMAHLWAGCSKSLRYELWAEYMQRMSLGELLSQIHDHFGSERHRNVIELQESIGHRDDMTRWSYTNLSEADRQAIKNPLFSIIETEIDAAFILNERNLYEYYKTLPCSRSGFIPWGAFKLDIIHMILDYIVHSNYQYLDAFLLNDMVKQEYTRPGYRDFRSVKYDYDISLASSGTETIMGAYLRYRCRPVRVEELNVKYYELMPAPIDYKHLWKAFAEDRFPDASSKHWLYYEIKFGTNPPIYSTCRGKTFDSEHRLYSVTLQEYYLGDWEAFEHDTILSLNRKYLKKEAGK